MKILIVRLSAMGDIIHAMPAIAGLRSQLPDAQVDWAVEERWAPLLTSRLGLNGENPCTLGPDQPLVDCLHLVHMKRWRQRPFSRSTRQEIAALRARLRAAKYDCVIDVQGAIRSALLGWASGAEVRAGARHPRELPARWWYTVQADTPARHVVDQAAETVSGALGRRIPVAAVPFPIDSASELWASETVGSGPFAIVNPGAGWGAKCWPADRYAALARLLNRNGTRVLINAGPDEEELARSVASQAPSVRIVQCSLLQLIALTRRAALFVGGDTGPLHLASALGIPVVAIFGPTDPERNGPYGGKFVVLRSALSKRDHTRRSSPESGLLTITVEEVAEAAMGLLGVPA